MEELFNIIFNTEFWYSVLRVTTPILFAALGALISDRAGVINIALEGIMLISALTGVLVSAAFQSAWLGLLGAVVIGALVGLLLAYFSLNLKTDIILSGIALNLMAAGGTVFVLFLVVNNKGISTDLASKVMPNITIPLIDKIPILGPIISGHNVLTYISILSVIFIFYLLYKTPLGLKIRAVGENPNAADSVGISVRKIKYIALVLSGVFAGFGGAFMSMGYLSYFSKNMTDGRGFIALAAEAMGGATPIGTFLTSLFFGFANALANNLQTLRVPYQLVQMIPYIATLFGLAIYASRKQSQIKKLKRQKVKLISKDNV
ncbi:ABC transporter permease [Vallitalea longa]|uniref:ABC transporter permease n=1 Tax=Vallitalea longa TaxID=2936439 RepID=A0A9W5YD01_9FIRM|nr:ABC transporter permease [Vallitalea longa]GKX30411.1 ABC transporter permease [Vallitalea longa]